MPEDRSLDEFAPTDATDADQEDGAVDRTAVDANDDADPTSEVEAGPEREAGSEREADDDPVEPATPTSTWHADGADCDRCGAVVERRWRDGDALVCADCVSW